MRNRLTRGLCVLATSAAITASLGFAAAGAASASPGSHHIRDASTACAGACTNLSSNRLDGDYILNAHGGATGTSLNLRLGATGLANEDFKLITNGTSLDIAALCAAGTIDSVYICTNYGDAVVDGEQQAFEMEFAPNGVSSGLCLGVATAGVPQRVSLQTCSTGNANVLWVGDGLNSPTGTLVTACWTAAVVCPEINATNTALANPLVLTVNAASRHPGNVLRIDAESPVGAVVPDRQLFVLTAGAFVRTP